MSKSYAKNPGRFVVDISAIGLDTKELAEIESEINGVVLNALALRKPKWGVGFRTWDLDRFRPGTLGIWIGDWDQDGIPDNIDLGRW